MNENNILPESKLAFLKMAFEGKKKERSKFEEAYDELLKLYSTVLLPSVNDTAYSNTASFDEKAKLIFSKLEILLNWPSFIGKNIVGVVSENNDNFIRFIDNISEKNIMPSVICPILITSKGRSREYFIKGKFTGTTLLSEESLETFQQVTKEINNLDSFLDSIEIPYGKFDNIAFVIAPKNYWDENYIWDDVIHNWVMFSLNDSIMKRNKADSFLIINNRHIIADENIVCCGSVNSRKLLSWLNMSNKNIWRNLYYEEFLHLFYCVEININSKISILNNFVDQYNKDDVMGFPLDKNFCRPVIELCNDAFEKKANYQKCYKSFLKELNVIIGKVKADKNVSDDAETDANNDLLLELCIMSNGLGHNIEYEKYKKLLKERNYENFFLIDLYGSVDDGICYSNKYWKILKKANNTSLAVIRAKVKFAEEIEITKDEQYELLLKLAKETETLDVVENELLGDYYFEFAKTTCDNKVLYLNKIKQYWEEALLLGSDSVGNKLYRLFGDSDKIYMEFLAMQCEESSIDKLLRTGVSDETNRLYLKLLAAKGDVYSLYKLAEYEYQKIPLLEDENVLQTYANNGNLKDLDHLLKQLEGMYENVYHNWSVFKVALKNDNQTTTKGKLREKIGLLYLLNTKICAKSDTERYKKKAENNFKDGNSAICYYWLGIFSLANVKEKDSLSSQKAMLESAQKYFQEALNKNPNYSEASKKYVEISVRLEKIEKELNPEIPEPTYSSSSGSGCVPDGTIVVIDNGSKVDVNKINVGDNILAYNHFLGRLEYAKVFAVINHDGIYDGFNFVTLFFSNHIKTSLVEAHCYFDVTLNKYITISFENADKYIGHEFLVVENNNVTNASLISVKVEVRKTHLYEIVTEYDLNFIADGVVSACLFLDKWLNIFDFVTNRYVYDEMQIQNGIDKYGLAAASDFPMLLPQYFEIGNGKYFNIVLAIGRIKKEDVYAINCLAEMYIKKYYVIE